MCMTTQSIVKEEMALSKKILWIARTIDLVTTTFGISLIPSTLGAGIIATEIVESIPEISYAIWRGVKQREILRKLLTDINDEETHNIIFNLLKKNMWFDYFVHKIQKTDLPGDIKKAIDNKFDATVDLLKQFIPLLLKGSWREILDLLPIVNRVSMQEREYLRVLRKIKKQL